MSFVVMASKVSGHYRRETLEGRGYLVVPMSLLTEGVFTANEGPLYYHPDDAKESVPAWNHKPIVVYHPTDANGDFISAATPSVLESQKVGIVLNTSHDGKLASEAWIDEEKANKVDSRIVAAIIANEPMNVSTAMISDILMGEGEFNGKAYVGRAVNYKPDHVALLPDKKGACSLADGAGLLVLQAAEDDTELEKFAKIRLDAMVANQLSHENLREALRKQLRAILILNDDMDTYPWIRDVYQTFFIVELGGKMYKVAYTVNGDDVSIDTSVKPVEVIQVTEYKTIDGKFVGNESPSTSTGETNMTKVELITKLIANGGYEDSDKPALEAMTEEKLAKLVSAIKLVANEKDEAKTVVQNVQMTWEQFLGTAPPEFAQVINRGVAVMNAQIVADTAAILEHAGDLYTKEELAAMNPELLSKTAKLVANMAKKAAPASTGEAFEPLPAYYGGNAGFVPNHFLANVGQGAHVDTVLPLPTTA